jgi:hypothetical protein
MDSYQYKNVIIIIIIIIIIFSGAGDQTQGLMHTC